MDEPKPMVLSLVGIKTVSEPGDRMAGRSHRPKERPHSCVALQLPSRGDRIGPSEQGARCGQ